MNAHVGTTITKVRVGRKEINTESALLHFLYRTGLKGCYADHPGYTQLLIKENLCLDFYLFVPTTK